MDKATVRKLHRAMLIAATEYTKAFYINLRDDSESSLDALAGAECALDSAAVQWVEAHTAVEGAAADGI